MSGIKKSSLHKHALRIEEEKMVLSFFFHIYIPTLSLQNFPL